MKRSEIPCFPVGDENRRTAVVRVGGDGVINTYGPTQSPVARSGQRARNPLQDTRPQLERLSIWLWDSAIATQVYALAARGLSVWSRLALGVDA